MLSARRRSEGRILGGERLNLRSFYIQVRKYYRFTTSISLKLWHDTEAPELRKIGVAVRQGMMQCVKMQCFNDVGVNCTFKRFFCLINVPQTNPSTTGPKSRCVFGAPSIRSSLEHQM